MAFRPTPTSNSQARHNRARFSTYSPTSTTSSSSSHQSSSQHHGRPVAGLPQRPYFIRTDLPSSAGYTVPPINPPSQQDPFMIYNNNGQPIYEYPPEFITFAPPISRVRSRDMPHVVPNGLPAANITPSQTVDSDHTSEPRHSPSVPGPYMTRPPQLSHPMTSHDPSHVVVPAVPNHPHSRPTKRKRVSEGDEVFTALVDADGLVANKACFRCNHDKAKCRYPLGSNACDRCQKKGVPCHERESRISPAAGRKQYVEAQLREKDAIIESLLKELYNPYRAQPLSLRTMRETTSPSENGHPDTKEWVGRIAEDADKTDVGIFSFVPPTESAAAEASVAATTSGSAEDGKTFVQAVREDGPLDDTSPIAMLTKLSLEDRADAESDEQSPSSGSSTAADDQSGPANQGYFKPGAGTDPRFRAKLELEYKTSPLINHKLMTENDVNELFDLYHRNLNSFVPLLDPVLHTPQETYARCPTLFSVVCAIASRYHRKKAHVYPVVMHIARNEAATAVMNGWKSLELAQAFLLLALYSPPARKWEDERGYLYTGIATRLAIDLNAHRFTNEPIRTEEEERECLNKRRLWMICFETDWAMAAHYGKPATLGENQIIRVSDHFYHESKFGINLMADIGLSAYNKILRIIAEFHTKVYSNPDSRTGLQRDLDFPALTATYIDQLDQVTAEWMEKFGQYDKYSQDPVYRLRCNLLPYAINYKKLLIHSFAFQQVLERGIQPRDRGLLEQCMNHAIGALEVLMGQLIPTGYMVYAPNGWVNYGAYAGAFLVKLLRPQFEDLITPAERQRIITLTEQLINAFHSPKFAIDERHSPKLWAYFFEQLLEKHKRMPVAHPESSFPDGNEQEQPSPSSYYAMPGYDQLASIQYWDPSSFGQPPSFGGPEDYWAQIPPQTSGYHAHFNQTGGGTRYHPMNPNAVSGGTNMMMPGYNWGTQYDIDQYGGLWPTGQ